MVSKNTRSSKNKQRTALAVIGRELTDDANMNASERNTAADDTEGTAVASAAVTESPTARNSTTKVRPPKKKTSPVWKHYNEIFVDEMVDDMVIKKPMASCKYCDDALNAASKQASPMQESAARNRRNVRTSQCYADLNEEPRRKRLNSFLRENTESGQQQSDFDTYCNEPLLSWKEDDYFDILSWWKAHGARYPILARLARDILAIPATTVASESTVSSRGRIVHKYRTRLDPQIVEALICTKDWVRASRKDESGVSSIADDLADLGLHIELQQDEGGPADAVENITELDVADN